ncbi:hypothetical protein H6G33_00675 [Calothrix sp. FACHB-1219]|uniref:hypothetical protein n=1 Tax=unclassified Calothrix TaxID=2619626 RepID=UPI001683A22D|nr:MULTISPECIES: hypothetical protein [unclassified Calothrix]MBD2201116.1 hypothetical protein [Calothrix sp. FACHB-168]MBD2215549.1 hypothetical protein [Calothrix sp. FACHB-1219]
MSIWLWVALLSYLLGAIIQWLQLSNKCREFEEYSHFPFVWVADLISKSTCLLKALFWPYNLIVDREG